MSTANNEDATRKAHNLFGQQRRKILFQFSISGLYLQFLEASTENASYIFSMMLRNTSHPLDIGER